MNLFQINLFVDNFTSMLGFYRDALGSRRTTSSRVLRAYPGSTGCRCGRVP